MKNGKLINESNCHRLIVRTNDSVETRNKTVNQTFGSHSHSFDFHWKFAKCYANSFLLHEQHLVHKIINKKKRREILKEKLLAKWWDFIDEQQNRIAYH